MGPGNSVGIFVNQVMEGFMNDKGCGHCRVVAMLWSVPLSVVFRVLMVWGWWIAGSRMKRSECQFIRSLIRPFQFCWRS